MKKSIKSYIKKSASSLTRESGLRNRNRSTKESTASLKIIWQIFAATTITIATKSSELKEIFYLVEKEFNNTIFL